MKMLIGGNWTDSSGNNMIEVINPYTGQVLDTVPQATEPDINKAIKSALQGKKEMAGLNSYERSRLLEKLSEEIDKNKEELATLLSKENGKTINDTRFEINTTVNLYKGFAEGAKRIFGKTVPMDTQPGAECEDMLAFTVRQPIGIIVGIAPFNYPVELF